MNTLFAFLLFLGPQLAADDVLSWYPLQVGHQWVYDCTVKNGDKPVGAYVDRTTAIVTVQEHIPTPEGLVIISSVQGQRDGHPATNVGCTFDKVPLLLRNSCVYPLHREAWDGEARTFKPEFPTYQKQISPLFCFPLKTGASWKGTGDWEWTVQGIGPMKEGPQDIPADAFRLMPQQGGSTVYVWFVKSIGPVAFWSWHHGTYTEIFEKLRK